jgi:hypothetical protein
MRRFLALACAGALLAGCAHGQIQSPIPARDYLIDGWKGLNVAAIAGSTSVIAGLHGEQAATAAKTLRATDAALRAATATYEAIKGPDPDIEGVARLAEDRLHQALADLDRASTG